MRRPSAAEIGLLVTVVIWSLNFTMTKYVLDHGFKPLAYSSLRFAAAAIVFSAITLAIEGTLWMRRRDVALLFGAAVLGIWLNQIGFVYSLKHTTASTVALVFGTMPIFTMLIARASGVETVSKRVAAAAGISFGGVALVAAGAGNVAGDATGIALALMSSATWALYGVAIVPLMRRYSPYRISAVGLLLGAALVLPTAAPQIASQDFGLDPWIWVIFAAAVLGPLVLTNVLYFTAIDRVGPSRSALFTNLQPFLGAVFAVLLLSETITIAQFAGGALIALGIAIARRPQAIPAAE
ncbi:MAG TPA: DMT family transporter [Gaiellaceae bacterium]|nr:DMT family transporter [Gaiellaceae bacterium]